MWSGSFKNIANTSFATLQRRKALQFLNTQIQTQFYNKAIAIKHTHRNESVKTSARADLAVKGFLRVLLSKAFKSASRYRFTIILLIPYIQFRSVKCSFSICTLIRIRSYNILRSFWEISEYIPSQFTLIHRVSIDNDVSRMQRRA